jgi:hypothetical protein
VQWQQQRRLGGIGEGFPGRSRRNPLLDSPGNGFP